MVLEIKDSQGDFPYEWVLTQDHSYTLKSLSNNSEWMHSLHGAYSESQYIYGEAIRLGINQKDKDFRLKVLSMGLGLGYLELITVFECTKANFKFEIESFELEDQLTSLFKFQCHLGLLLVNFLVSDEQDDLDKLDNLDDFMISKKVLEFLESFDLRFPHEHSLCLHYNFSLKFYLKHFFIYFLKDYGFEVLKVGFQSISKLITIEETLKLDSIATTTSNSNFESSSSLNLNGPMDFNLISDLTCPSSKDLSLINKTFNVIFYDAFSSNTQSELWSEDFLTQFLSQFADPNFCVFSTYAKVGTLNRSLKANGFKFIPKKGFANKRESTLALKI